MYKENICSSLKRAIRVSLSFLCMLRRRRWGGGHAHVHHSNIRPHREQTGSTTQSWGASSSNLSKRLALRRRRYFLNRLFPFRFANVHLHFNIAELHVAFYTLLFDVIWHILKHKKPYKLLYVEAPMLFHFLLLKVDKHIQPKIFLHVIIFL